MAKVQRSVALSVFATFGNLAISLGLVIIVSRYLPPAVIGSYILAYAVITFIDPIRELQLPSYVIRLDRVDREILKPVAWVALVTSAAALLVCLVGSVVFWLTYETSTVATCLLIMAAGFLFRPLSMTPLALLARDLRYDAIAKVKLGGALIKALVTLALLFGTSLQAEALAVGILAEILFEIIALTMVRREFRWVLPSWRGSGEVFRFCLEFSGAQLANRTSISLAQILIGSWQGLAIVAFYNRGKQLVSIFRSGVERAILPIALSEFSRSKDDRAAVKDAYSTAIGALTGLSWPGLVCLAVLARPVILTLFGPNWEQSVVISQVLTLGAIVFAATALSQQAHAAIGETRVLLKREGFMAVPRISVLFLTAPIGAEAVAWGLLGVGVLQFGVNQHLLKRSLGFHLGDFLAAIWKSASVAAGTGLAGYLSLTQLTIVDQPWEQLLLHGSVAGLAWIAMMVIVRHPLLQFGLQALGKLPLLGRIGGS